MSRRRPAEIHVNHERWLISYADFITLLFAFFVVMYSISQVNEGKYKVLSGVLSDSFHTISFTENSATSPTVASNELLPAQMQSVEVFNELTQALEQAFAGLIESEIMTVSSNGNWLQIQLNDSILFTSGSAEVSDQAKTIFTKVAHILSTGNNAIQIEGFTDNIPISTEKYPSNWELSTARASAIVKWMVNSGIAAKRLAAVGFGEHQPIADNSTPKGRNKNRRVAIMVSREQRIDPLDFLTQTLSVSPNVSTVNDAEPAVETVSLSAAEAETIVAPVPEVNLGVDSNKDTVEATEATADRVLQPIKLDGGDLLFSSDPDLPRNN